jgi:Rieske Fe-S protein
MAMERRKFLESACKACLFAGAGILISELTACSPAANVIKVPISENAVRLPVSGFANSSIQILRPDGWFYNIAVHKTEDGQFEAMLMECTHQQNQLIASANGFQCPLHGSRFNLNGQVTKGPAERPLKKFTTGIDQDQVVIQLKS